jgi:hypothetical protein
MPPKKGNVIVEDLKLEFEEEGEAPKEALDVGTDLAFSIGGEAVTPEEATTEHEQESLEKPVDNVQPIRPSVKKDAPVASQSSSSSSNEIVKLKNQVESLQRQLSVEQTVTNIKVEYTSEAKLLDFKVGQVLNQLYKKNPNAKNEVLTIKKYLQEFLAKTKL